MNGRFRYGRPRFALGRHREGYSLVEMLAAMAIFSMCVVALMELFGVGLRSTSDSLDYTQAMFLAEGVMEERLAEGISFETTDDGDFGDAYPRHTWTLEVEETEQRGLYQVRVVVLWQERQVEKEYVLTTLVADRDIDTL